MRNLTFLLLLLCSLPCAAVNLVINPGFENSPTAFPGWTVTRAASGSTLDPLVGASHSGGRAAWFMASGTLDDMLSQTLTTQTGVAYTFSFWLRTDNYRGTNNHFSASVNGVTLLNLDNDPTTPYRQFSFVVVGTGSDTIAFSGRSPSGDVILDDVFFDVRVPELSAAAGQLPVLLAGMLLAVSRRRRIAGVTA